MTITAVFNLTVDRNFRKGAISIISVMAVISVAVTALSMNISIDLVTDALSGQQHAGDMDWFENTIASDTADLCNSDRNNHWSPATTNYTRNIGGLESISVELEDDFFSTYDERWKYVLDFGDETEEVYFDNNRRIVGSLDCDDSSDAISFKGMQSGSQITLDGGPHNYRLNSDEEGQVEVQVYESSGD